MALPENIRPQWNGLIQRLQGKACQQNGHAIITISILVDAGGNPILWTEPSMQKIEPMGSSQQFFYAIMQQALNHRE